MSHPRHPARIFDQSDKIKNMAYAIRGPVADLAERMEADGHRILKLNTGNPATFGFDAPDVIMRDMISALPTAQGYSLPRALFLRGGRSSPAMSWRISQRSISTMYFWATAFLN